MTLILFPRQVLQLAWGLSEKWAIKHPASLWFMGASRRQPKISNLEPIERQEGRATHRVRHGALS